MDNDWEVSEISDQVRTESDGHNRGDSSSLSPELKKTSSIGTVENFTHFLDAFSRYVPAVHENKNFSFNLSVYDPDKSNFSVEEWLTDCRNFYDKYKIDEEIMILKIGDALQGRAKRFFNNWRPSIKNIRTLEDDLISAFPEKDTFHIKLVRAANMKSTDFPSISEYALEKIRALKRYYSELPWNRILSPVIGGIVSSSVREAIKLHQPNNQKELMLLLREYESHAEITKTNLSESNKRRKIENKHSEYFAGKCYNCGKTGHKSGQCRNTTILNRTVNENSASKLLKCNFCQRVGHTENTCFKKHGGPKIQRIQGSNCNISAKMQISNTPADLKFSYIVDSGADYSVITHSVVKSINNVKIIDFREELTGFGNKKLMSLGKCTLYVALKEITIEVDFIIVPDGSLGNISALIGWETISRPGLDIVKRKYGLDLRFNEDTSQPEIQIRNINFGENSELNERQRDSLNEFIVNVQNNSPEAVTTGQLEIQLNDNIPVAFRPRRLAYRERIQLKEILNELLEQKIIRESTSTYASPIVLVKKKDNSIRLCVDYRWINKKCVRDRYPLPNLHDQLDALYAARYYTTLDMKSGFHQIKIAEQSKQYTSFVTPDGQFEYNRMPFGFANAPSCYQRCINKALGPLKDTICQVYLDDVMIPSTTIEEGIERAELVIKTLSEAGFKLNLQKCSFLQTQTEYLGHIISYGSIKPSPRKVNALLESQPPNSVKGVRQLMGLAGYFRRFIEKFSLLTAPITALTKKDCQFKWTEAHEKIRQQIINTLTSQPVLRIFNPNLETQLHTDASTLGIAGVLMQKEDNLIRPVAYFSRRTTEAESKYHSYDLETLAMVESVEHFRMYLYGLHFTIYTDCNSVRATALKKDLHPRVARWWMKLQDFDYDVEYRPGCKMGHVDYLSRNPVISRIRKQTSATTIKQFQEEDDFCISLDNSPNASFIKQDNMVYYKEKTKSKDVKFRCYVPEAARLKVMKTYHDDAAHIGWQKAILRMREELYWPRMTKCLKKYVENCRSCAVGKSFTGRKPGYYQMGEKAIRPLDVWHIDHAGPLVKSRGCTEILVTIDAFAKYCIFTPIKNKTTNHSIVALKKQFDKVGKPRKIVADRARAFTSTTFQEFLRSENIELHLIATGVPRSNGQVERVMRTLFNMMRSVLTNEKESKWTTVLPQIEFVLNETISSATGYTPNALMFGKKERWPEEEAILEGVPKQPVENIAKIQEDAKNKLQEGRYAQETRHNKTRVKGPVFKKGDAVVVQDTQAAGSGKLGPKYLGPFKITEVLQNDRFVLQRSDNRSKVPRVAALDQLRAWPNLT